MTAIAAIASVQARIGTIEQRLGIARPSTSTQSTNTLGTGTLGSTSTAASTTTVGGIDLTGSFESVAASVESALQSTPSYGPATTTSSMSTSTLDPSTPYADLFEQAGEKYGIDPKILAGVGYVESRFQTDVVSGAGAVGMMQFMPATAAAMGVDPRDPASAIDGAARYLRAQVDRFGSIDMALAAYNVGPTAMANAGSVQAGTQAEKYVTAVLAAAERV